MNTLLNKFTVLVAVVALVLFAGAQDTFAAVQLNDHYNDCDTVMVGNQTTGDGIYSGYGDCWDTSAYASDGDTINAVIYFHNSGTTPASNVSLKLNKPSGLVSSYTFRGSVSGGGDYEQGNATINLANDAKLIFEGAVIETQSTGRRTVSNASDLFTSSGLNIGTVYPGWANQGTIKVEFTVEEAQTTTLDIQTTGYEARTDTSARMIGHFEGDEVTSWFEYDTDQNDLIARRGDRTNDLYRGTGSGTFKDTAYNLSPGTTYYFMACGEDIHGDEDCDPSKSFTTLGGTTPPPGVMLDVNTLTETNRDTDSATLRGEVVVGNDVDVWFVFSQSSNPSCSDSSIDINVSGTYNTNDIFTTDVSNLDSGETYYYRACGEDSNNLTSYGSIESFTINTNLSDQEPDVTTNKATGIDEDDEEATLEGEYDMNDYDGKVFFAWVEGDNLEDELDDVDLENDIDDIDSDVEIEMVDSNANAGDRDTNVKETITNLDTDEEYFFRLCVEFDNEIKCGSVKSFDFDDTSDGLDVTTENATSIDEDSAKLNGEYEDADDADIFFVWGEDKNDIEDIEDENEIEDIEDKNQFRDVEIEIVKKSADGNDRSVSETIKDLDKGVRYYFRLCAEQDNDLECGSVKSFTTDGDDPSDDPATVGVCSALATGITNATLQGSYVSDSSGDVYFRYGRTASLGSNTTTKSASSGSRVITQLISGLSANTTYYCQMVVENDEGTSTGDLGTFRTRALPVIPGNPNPPVIVPSSGNGSIVFLEIDDHQETATRGEVLQYDVEWANTSRTDLDEVAVFIQLPKAARFISTTDGTYNRRDHTVYVALGELKAGDEDDMTVTVRVSGAREGEPIVAEAILAFENPEAGGNALMNAVELDADTYTFGAGGLTAGLFGLGLPTTLVGWMLFLLILILLILAVRYFYLHERDRRAYRNRP